MRATFVLAVSLMSAAVACAGPGDNMLDNPGFEKGAWPQSPAWKGDITLVEEPVLSGEKSGKLVAEDGQGTIYSGYFPASVGLDYTFSIMARGEGTISLRSIQLRNHPEDRYIIERPENQMELTDEWQRISMEISPRDPLVTRIAGIVALEGEGAVACLDDAMLTAQGLPGGELSISPGYLMIAPGKSVELEINVRCDAGPIREGALVISAAKGDEATREEIAIAGESTSWTFTVAEDTAPGQATLTVVNADVGVGASAWVDVVDAQTYAQFAALAQGTEIDTPAHLLFLGDSLTDQRRGHNYTDMVGFWLRTVHGEVSYRNAGVGGDYITRLWQRLQGEGAHRQEMYDGLFEPTPTRVFIWLGHNDSKLKPKPHYKTPDDYPFDPVVPLETFEETFVTAIEHIREHAPDAEFTIISASSSVHEITRAMVVKRIAERGNGGSYFGKPDVLEMFNERMQAVAETTGEDYLDVYTPTKTHPDKPSLFTADGVHMSQEGNLQVAEEILRYLGR